MTAKRTILVTVFILLEGVVALGMIAISVHGPSGLPVAAGLYFVAAAVITSIAGRLLASPFGLTGIFIALLTVAPALVAALDRLERMAYDRRIAATRVGDVRDTVIVSTTGRPIGVQLSYTVSVPSRGYFGISPSLYGRDARSEGLWLNAVRWTIDGRSDPIPFEPGRTHEMVVQMYPPTLVFTNAGRCLATALARPLPDSVVRAPLRVSISETKYGNTYRGDVERLTRASYDLAELYRGVLAEGLAPCR